jgi:serine/threonine-protein kinase
MEDQERLTKALADRYRIEREIGAGGMATVYLAHDLRHDRNVAIKVLRPELAAVLGAERFLAEIKVTANLQHPHILPLHDSGEADGFLFYVMPFVDGESLRDRLERETQLSVEDALQITEEVADGLSYAHRLEVIHRDIKPENILLSGGHALIADFGIARAVTEAGGSRLTETGLSLGTPHYMSPEQASGDRYIDARSDQYALGCVSYEMLVGEPPHTGPNPQAIISKVLTQPAPRVRDLRDLVHPQVDAAIGKALAKLPADRFATVRQFAAALRISETMPWESPGRTEGTGEATVGPRPWPTVLAWSLVGVLGVSLIGLQLLRSTNPSSSLEGVARLALGPHPADSISIGAGATTVSGVETDVLAISSDGRRIAFVGREAGETTTHIYVRELGRFEARRLPGTESAASPFFRPDGEWLGFYSWQDRRLKTMPITGSVPQVVCECDPIVSAHWGPDDTIVMDSEGLQGLRIVSASGGDPEQITFPERDLGDREYAFNHPRFLPDGRHVLATAWGGGGATRRVALFSVGSGERTTLLEEGWAPEYVESGHVVYQRENQLWAVPFDLGSLEITGTPVPVVDSVFSAPFSTLYGISSSGSLVFAPGPVPDVRTSLYFAGPSGDLERVSVDAGAWTTWGPKLSPDGTRIVFAGPDPAGFSGGQATSRIWMHEIPTGSTQPITDSGPGDYWPIWTPDGHSVVFTSLRGDGGADLYQVSADDPGIPEVLYSDDAIKQAHSWLPGGDGLIFQRQPDPESDFDIWLLRLGGDGTAVSLVEGTGNENHPALSPDGRWLAYTSDRSGQYEIYLRPYPDLDGLQKISTAGGMGPLWRSDSRELYFYTSNTEGANAFSFMGVALDPDPGIPTPLWESSSVFSLGSPYGSGYDVTRDSRRLLVAINEKEYPLFLPELRIVFNWFEDLTSRFER